MLVSFIELAYLFFMSLTTLFVLRKAAKRIGLVDKPQGRKQHKGDIPLVGGISICLTLSYFLFNNPSIIPHTAIYTFCLITLVTVGAIDDKFDISFKIRFLVQALLSVVMMIVGKIQLLTLGDILGTGNLNLGWFGYIVTILAVVGAINAFNMIDGLDGLLGGVSIASFGGLGIMLFHDGQLSLSYLCLVIVVLIVPYLCLNLGIFGLKRKVFMGDAGSMLIGFTMIWFLLLSSQNGKAPPLRPVTALWLISVPLMDMVTVMLRRIRRGCSPFKPDREHLHHIFQRIGFTSSQTVIIIFFIAILCSSFGVLGEIYDISEAYMFYCFLALFILYNTLLSYIWRISSFLKKYWKKKEELTTFNSPLK